MIVSASHRMQVNAATDAQLVAASLNGDRQAFGRIVERYQTLICSLAYNATGSLIQSEDLAQETFIAAWKRLAELREPNKLRAWLCGIARNLANNSIRRGRRDAARHAEPVESAAGAASHDRGPVEEAISREEEAILWRSLERIPELYREPLILFYRENQSVERVAEALEISGDTVKQRLSRGRKMLQEQVAAFVEGALKRSAPGKAFAFGVLAGLPAVVASTRAATLGAGAVKGTIAAKSASSLGLLGALLGPALGLLGGYLGAKLSIENTQSKRERQFMVRLSWAAAVSAFGFTAAFLFLMLNARTMLASNPRVWVAALIALVFGYVLFISLLTHWANRRQGQIRTEDADNIKEPPDGAGKAAKDGVFEYRSNITLLGWPLVHVRAGKSSDSARQVAKGWIAVGDSACGILLAVGGIAVGGVSVGGLSVGLISIGGAAFGAVALGGWAMGGWATGGGAVAWFAAHGGLAIAQHHAMGGLAVAHEYAMGGTAIGIHANDGLAKTVIGGDRFIALSRLLMENSGWLVVLPVLSVVFGLHQWRKPRNEKPKADRARLPLAIIVGLGCQMEAEQPDYVVADAVGKNDPFHAAVEKLLAHRHGQIVPLEVDNLAASRDALRQIQPARPA